MPKLRESLKLTRAEFYMMEVTKSSLLKKEAEDVFSWEVTSRGHIISLITITSSVYSDYMAFLTLF